MSDREETIERLDNVVEYAEYKALGKGNIRDDTRERTRVKYLNTIVSAANAKRQLLRDKDLEELEERLEALEEQQNSEYRVK